MVSQNYLRVWLHFSKHDADNVCNNICDFFFFSERAPGQKIQYNTADECAVSDSLKAKSLTANISTPTDSAEDVHPFHGR